MVVLSQARTATSATWKFQISKWKMQVVKFIIINVVYVDYSASLTYSLFYPCKSHPSPGPVQTMSHLGKLSTVEAPDEDQYS